MKNELTGADQAGTTRVGDWTVGLSETIRKQFQAANRFLILSHIRPDGDAIGSLMGLGQALIQAGKDVRMVLADGVPQSFHFLPGSDQIHRSTGSLDRYDYVIVVDCSDLLRVGSLTNGKGLLGERVPDLNIDHHVTNLNYAKINLVVSDQPATAAIIASNLPFWGLSYNQSIATALLTGIVTDTIGFRTSNVTPLALRLAAMLMEHGADLPEIYMQALVSKTFEAAQYWGLGLGKLQRDEDLHLIWTTLSLTDRQEAQYPGNDDADLVNMLSTVDSDVAVIFIEQKNGRVKVSWRSRSGYDVSKIGLQFGGGGHAAAAGAEISGTLETVQQQVLEATRSMLEQVQAKNGKNPAQS
jgi:phosphoesterase RecJ-like protein